MNDTNKKSNYNTEKIDEMVLALLHLTTFENKLFNDQREYRAWKGHDWDTMDRLYEKGLISSPHNKNKSVSLSMEGADLSKKLFEKFFTEDL